MTDIYTKKYYTKNCKVVSCYLPATAGDYLVPIPFRGRLVHCQTNVVVVVGGTNDITLSLEKDAAGGTSLGTATIAASSAVGTEDTVTLSTSATTDDFIFDNQDICMAVTGSQTSGSYNAFLIFEPAVGL